jgi:hypothetical protein
MNEETKNIVAEQMKILPQELRDAITAIDYPEKLQTITKNNKLMIDQAGNLETETTLVLLGLEPLTDYVSNLVNNVGLSKDQALVVAHDVDELIFKNVRDTLRAINEAAIAAENEAIKTPGTPSKEETLAGIENPAGIATKEQSVSFSTLDSNTTKEKKPDENLDGIEIRKNMLPEIKPEAMLPIKPVMPYHENVSPIENIVETKMTEAVAVPKEMIVVEEKIKLPGKTLLEKTEPTSGGDPYREPIN